MTHGKWRRKWNKSGLNGVFSAEEIQRKISNILGDYAEDVTEMVQLKSEDVADFAVKLLRETSPKRKRKDGGAYAKSWTRTKQSRARLRCGRVGTVVHNAKHYRLTHLLENGHANRDGSFTKPVVHIQPVEEQVIKKFIADLKNAIKKG